MPVLIALILALISTSCSSISINPGVREAKETEMNTAQTTVVIAHRGFRGLAPENTLLAAQKGHDVGADYWELDVAASSDGELVVIHDDNLSRTTDARALFPGRKPWIVYDFSLAELKLLSAGSWYARTDPFKQIESGTLRPAEMASFDEEKIPTLKEALELTKKLSWKVNIEIKDASGRACDSWIVEKTAELVRSLDMANDVIVSSFNHEYLMRMKTAAPEIRRAALIDRPVLDPIAILARLEAVALNPNHRYLDEATTKRVLQAGYQVLVWTVNEKPDMERLLSWGVTGIITDFPDRALEILHKNAL
jgi:glycerophosphoryl diester phosphodiesterase